MAGQPYETLNISQHSSGVSKHNPHLFISIGRVYSSKAVVNVGFTAEKNVQKELGVGGFIRYESKASPPYDVRVLSIDEDICASVAVVPHRVVPSPDFRPHVGVPFARPTERKARYSEKARANINRRLAALEQRLKEQAAQTQEDLGAIHAGMNYVGEELDRQEAGAWTHLFMGVMMSLALRLSIDPDRFWDSVRELFGEILMLP